MQKALITICPLIIKSTTLILALLALSFMTGCGPAERSAAKVLDNAGSVIQSGSDKLWIEDNQPTPTPQP
jgi:hypothetical protein